MDHQRIRPPAPDVAEVLLSDLVSLVSCFNLRGVGNTLDATLEAARNPLDGPSKNNEAVVIDGVHAFMRLVDEQRGHHLSDAVADMLISAAQEIVSALDD